jgi:hypothetical protein
VKKVESCLGIPEEKVCQVSGICVADLGAIATTQYPRMNLYRPVQFYSTLNEMVLNIVLEWTHLVKAHSCI